MEFGSLRDAVHALPDLEALAGEMMEQAKDNMQDYCNLLVLHGQLQQEQRKTESLQSVVQQLPLIGAAYLRGEKHAQFTKIGNTLSNLLYDRLSLQQCAALAPSHVKQVLHHTDGCRRELLAHTASRFVNLSRELHNI